MSGSVARTMHSLFFFYFIIIFVLFHLIIYHYYYHYLQFTYDSLLLACGVRRWIGQGSAVLAAGGHLTNLDKSRTKAYCVCSRCGWGLFGYFLLLSIISLFFLPLSCMDDLGFYVHFSRISFISGL